MNRRNLVSTGSLLLLSLLFIGLVILSGLLFKGVRIDLTENRQYTLSDGTYAVLEGMQEPVTIYYFFSEAASAEFPQIRSYARWVDEMLDDMADRSGGKLTVRRIDPAPFSPEEDQAAGFGLQAVPVGAAGDSLTFGLAATNSLDDVQIIPFLNPAKQPFVEYDVIKLVSMLSHPEPLRVGLLSSLDMGPGFDMNTQQPRAPWVMHDQLAQLFDLVTVPEDPAAFPEDIELLLVVHPKALSEAMQYRIDQFVLAGGRLVAFVDPFAEADLGDNPNDPMARLNAGSSSTLGPLFDAWGVAFDATSIVGDPRYALQVNTQASAQPVRHLAILSLTGEAMNADDIVSGDLEAVNVSSAGWFDAREGAITTLTPLLESSENAAPIEASRLRFLANPADLQAGFSGTGDRYPVAVRLTGPAQAAFPAPPTDLADFEHRASAVAGGI
ncbi:MAG: Gldg family protein, partial [Pseudomonadota bacterium]